jgi:hypothetical protein
MAKRKNPVKKVHNCLNGQVYYGKDVKPALKLDARIRAYEAYCQKSNTGGKDFKRPGSLRK